jgi:pseudouridine-5'-phosphate glycosidase
MLLPDLFQISSEVADALLAGKPIVALESTVISHGLPRPTNLETAYRLESIVREVGAVPATIGIIAGRLIVGLNNDQVQLLAEASDIKKISTRDIPIAVSQNWHGATTVASTCWIRSSRRHKSLCHWRYWRCPSRFVAGYLRRLT